MKIFLLIYLALAVVVIVFCISAIIKRGKYKYRIKKVTVGTKDEYYVQKHFLFFWYTCQELQWAGGYEEVCFDTREEAEKYIKKQKEKIDKKTEYFYY